MSPKSSVPQAANSVSQVLMSDKRHTPNHMKEMEMANALEMAQDIAKKEKLGRVYVVKKR